MLRRTFVGVSAALFVGLMVQSAYAQSEPLPPLDAEGMVMPLTFDQLDAGERITYATLGDDDRRRLLYSRAFLRYCRAVIAEQIPPLELPPLPARANYSRQFFSQEESENIVDVAIGMKLYARMGQARTQ
jgi:hypothetical protein